jgi:predicted secreted protein
MENALICSGPARWGGVLFEGETVPFSIPLAIALFVTIWFVVLFSVLPFGARAQSNGGDYLRASAPDARMTPRVLHKILWTTGIAGVVFVVVIAAVAFIG